MIQLLHLYLFLSLTAKCAIAETSMTSSLDIMTLSDHTHLTCCPKSQNMSNCSFYIDFIEISPQPASNPCCELIISGQQLLQTKADEQLQTAVNVSCVIQTNPNGRYTSPNVTITVWTLSFSGKHALILLCVLGALVLFSLLIFICLCIWCCVNKKQGRRGQFHPVSYRTQALDSDTQGVSTGIEEELEDKAELEEDEIFYATVNHSSSGVSSAVKFEPGTDYATVVIN